MSQVARHCTAWKVLLVTNGEGSLALSSSAQSGSNRSRVMDGLYEGRLGAPTVAENLPASGRNSYLGAGQSGLNDFLKERSSALGFRAYLPLGMQLR